MKLKFARSLQLKAVNELKKAGFTAKLNGKKVHIDVGQTIKSVDMEQEGSIKGLISRLKAMFRPEESIYDEPPDTAVLQKSGQFPEEKLPEGYSQYILPATAKPNIAIPLYEAFLKQFQLDLGKPVQTGQFGANMKVELLNDGPVTIIIDSKNKE